MNVNDNEINVIKIEKKKYISLTDLARYADEEDPIYPIQNWVIMVKPMRVVTLL